MDDTQRSIGRLEGKIDLIIDTMDKLKDAFETLESGRLSTLEKDFANLGGKITIIMVGVSAGTSFGLFLIEKYLLK